MPYLDINIKYGSEMIDQFLPAGRGTVHVLESAKVQSEITDLRLDLLSAIENPLDSPSLKAMVEKHYSGSGKRILLLADDNTRPNQHTKLLHPILLEYLIETCRVKKEDIGILIASGTHRPPTKNEIKERILGEKVFAEYADQILVHDDQNNLQDLGQSSNNTPITINQDAFNACLLIPVTDSEYHYFAGIAGTVKQLFPGVAGRITTNTNHIQMFDKRFGFKTSCRLGNTDSNPVISDIKEMTEKVQKHTPVFCVDAIMDEGEITSLNAGNIISLHNLANGLLQQRRVVKVPRPADLVIVSVGKLGLNLYQAGKGIHAAWNAAKQPGGTILLLAPCEDGPGNEGYQKTMESVQDMDLDQALEWVIDNNCSLDTFKIGNQKPVDTIRILKTLGENQIKILSEMDPGELRQIYRMAPLDVMGTPQESLRHFVDQFLLQKPDALIYVLKNSGLYIVPQHQQ